jgi:6-phospho-beta-glucosidase
MANFYFGDPFCLGIVPTYLKKVWKQQGVTVNFTDEELALIKKYTVDFFSFSYYRSSTYDYDYAMKGDTGGLVGKENPYLKDKAPKPWGWPVDPEGIRYTLNVLYDRYHLPLYIVENGVGLDENLNENGTIEDDFRIHYITEHVKNVNLAIEDGVDCRGYLYWGPIDVVSAGTGEMKKRYGFVYVDRFNDGHGTLERAKKKSYDFMKELCESNGESVLNEE